MISHWKLASIWFSIAACTWKRLRRFVVASLAPVISKKKDRDRELQKIFTSNRWAPSASKENTCKIYDNSRFNVLAWNGHCRNQWQVLEGVILFLFVRLVHNTIFVSVCLLFDEVMDRRVWSFGTTIFTCTILDRATCLLQRCTPSSRKYLVQNNIFLPQFIRCWYIKVAHLL